MKKPINIDEYISGFPNEIQKMLQQFRVTIKEAAPKAEEVISYGIPALKLNGMLVWFGAHTNHIGFYPMALAIEGFKKELSIYKGAEDSVHFPLDKHLALGLITKKIVKFRIIENLKK